MGPSYGKLPIPFPRPWGSHVLGGPSGGSIEGSSADPRKSHQAVGLGRPLGMMFPNGVGEVDRLGVNV